MTRIVICTIPCCKFVFFAKKWRSTTKDQDTEEVALRRKSCSSRRKPSRRSRRSL